MIILLHNWYTQRKHNDHDDVFLLNILGYKKQFNRYLITQILSIIQPSIYYFVTVIKFCTVGISKPHSFGIQMSSLQHNNLHSFCLVLVLWRLFIPMLSFFPKKFLWSFSITFALKRRDFVRLLLFLSLTQCAFVSYAYSKRTFFFIENDDVTNRQLESWLWM